MNLPGVEGSGPRQYASGNPRKRPVPFSADPIRPQWVADTNTVITFERDPDTPLVELQKGEILCDLVENPSRHLAVYVNAMRITDTGTTFSVRRTESGAVVVVRAGTVRVSGAHLPESELVQTPVQSFQRGLL